MSNWPPQHCFDGEQLTVSQIQARLPEYTKDSIRAHLASGRNTTALIRGYRHTAPKPGRSSQLRYGRKIPHAMGGPPPMSPRRTA